MLCQNVYAKFFRYCWNRIQGIDIVFLWNESKDWLWQGGKGQCSDIIHLPDIMPLGHLIPRDRPGWVAGVMMGGASVWCQHPALGGNQRRNEDTAVVRRQEHSIGIMRWVPHWKRHNANPVVWILTHGWCSSNPHPFCVYDNNHSQQLAMAETIVLKIMSLGAEIDHNPCAE